MPFQKGHKKYGGRPQGTKNKITRDVSALLDKLQCNPLEGLARIANDPKVNKATRARCYAELSKYVAPQLKAIEHSGPGGGPIEVNVSYAEQIRGRIAGIASRSRA